MRYFRWGIQFAAVLSLVSFASAQETRSVIFGRVLDPTNSAVVGARVIVTNTSTNVANSVVTNETGYYEANFLIAGNYQVTAESAGFKRSVRSGIILSVGSRVEINAVLELGEVTETVSVTAEAPLVDTSSTAGSNMSMTSRDIQDLPTFNNSPMMNIKFAPGMQGPPNRTYNGLNGLGGSATTQAIGRVGGNDWTMDGAPTMGSGYSTSWLPFSTAIAEFKVETSQFDASVGHTTGATVSIMTRAGTNAFHGDLTYQTWQSILNAAEWGIKRNYYRSIAVAEAAGNTAEADRLRNSRIQPSLHNHTFGGTIGGPVVRDKLFFFVTYDGFTDRKLRRGSPNVTIPTLLNRQGDFSDLAQVGARYQLYDPLSVTADPARPGHYVRTPIVNNVLPQTRIINPAYKTYNGFLPTPNNPPQSATQEPLNNYVASEPLNWWQYTLTNRIDYQHSEKNRLFGRWTTGRLIEDTGDWTYEVSRKLMTAGCNRNWKNATVDWVYTPSSTLIVDTVASVNHFEQYTCQAYSTPESRAKDFKPSDVGLPAYMDAKAGDNAALPAMFFDGYIRGSDGLGRPVGRFQGHQTASGKVNLTHIRGDHTLRAGFNVQKFTRYDGAPEFPQGRFQFTNFYTRREDDTLTPAGNLGHSWAAFMMGLPTEASADTNDNNAVSNPYYGLFFADSWRVNRKLTLNLGVRLDYEVGRLERYDRVIGEFDPNVDLPITQLGQAAYAAKPIPELAASAFVVRGGSVYPGTGGLDRRLDDNEFMVMPRIGFAYQITPRTVLRGGFGFAMDRQDALNTAVNQYGFSRTTFNPITNNFGVDWLSGNPGSGVSPLADPFPVRSDGTRFDLPVGSSLGAMARAGLGFDFGGYDNPQRARTRNWRLELQREFGGSMMASAAYIGLYGDRVNITRTISSLPEQYWADGMVRDNATASNLNQNVPNPFFIDNFASLQTSDPRVYQAMSSLPFFQSPIIRKANLLRPFPHMTQGNGLRQLRTPDGEVKSHALELIFRRRMAEGLMVQANYTALHQRDRDFYYNEFDPLPSRRLSDNGTPHRFAIVGIYELPFGRTKPMLQSGIGNALLGGWQVAWTYEWQPGPYLDFGNVFYTGDLNDIALDKSERTLDRWFNTDGFEKVPARQPAAFHRRVFPVRVGNAKGDGLKRLDASLQRSFRLREGLEFQLKADAINLINRTQFAEPNVNPTSTDFGRVTANSASTFRFIMLQARLKF